MRRTRSGRWRAWVGGVLAVTLCGCGPLESVAQGIKGPSEVVGRNQQWFLDNVGEPCSKEVSAIGGDIWLYAQSAEDVTILECGTPGVRRSWGIYFSGHVCTAAMSLDRPPQ